MSYRNPTPHEIRMSKVLQQVMDKAQKHINKLSGGKCDLFIWCASTDQSSKRLSGQLADAPVANYVANIDREGAAMTMLELIAKWQANEQLPPIHELRDANGRPLDEILKLN